MFKVGDKVRVKAHIAVKVRFPAMCEAGTVVEVKEVTNTVGKTVPQFYVQHPKGIWGWEEYELEEWDGNVDSLRRP